MPNFVECLDETVFETYQSVKSSDLTPCTGVILLIIPSQTAPLSARHFPLSDQCPAESLSVYFYIYQMCSGG